MATLTPGLPCLDGGDQHDRLKHLPADPSVGIPLPALECQDCGAQFPVDLSRLDWTRELDEESGRYAAGGYVGATS